MYKIENIEKHESCWQWTISSPSEGRSISLHTDKSGNGVYHNICSSVTTDGYGRKIVYILLVRQPCSDSFSLAECTTTRSAFHLIRSWMIAANISV